MSKCDISITVIPRSINPASTWKFSLNGRMHKFLTYRLFITLTLPLSLHSHKATPRAPNACKTLLNQAQSPSKALTTNVRKPMTRSNLNLHYHLHSTQEAKTCIHRIQLLHSFIQRVTMHSFLVPRHSNIK